jgi:hypothetical protein
VIAAFALAQLGLFSGTAHAHDKTVWHGSDRAWVWGSHDHLDVEDNECDGNLVWAEGYYGEYETFIRVYDLNGCTAGWYHVDGFDFYTFRICEENVGCKAWSAA